MNFTSDESKTTAEQIAEKVSIQSDRKLRKALSFQDLFFLSLGGMIGSGWLVAIGYGASIAGPAIILSWIIGGVIILFIALTFAEISSAIPKSGAIVRYPQLALGGYTGYIVSWAYFLGAASMPPVEAEATLIYANSYLPSTLKTVSGISGHLTTIGILFGIVLMVVYFFLNYFGIKFLGKFNTYVTWFKLIIPVITFIIVFIFLYHSDNLTGFGFMPYGSSMILYAIPTAGIIFSYIGFRQALQFGGEAKNPQRDIPRAIIFSVLIVMVIYVLIELAFIGAVNWTSAGVAVGEWSTIGPANALGSTPLLPILKYSGIAGIVAFSYFLMIDAWISPSGTGWIYEGNASRVAYGISSNGVFPRTFLNVTQKTRIPLYALLLTLFVGILLLFSFSSWYVFVGFITSITVITYVIGPIAIYAFRKHAPELKKPFKLRMAGVVAPIAFIGAGLIVYWSGIKTLGLVYSTIFVGIPLFYFLYGTVKLELSKAYAYAVGIIGVIIAAILDVLEYFYVLYPSSSESLATNEKYFIVIWIVQLILIFGITLATQRKVKEEHKKMFKSSYWLLIFIFFSYLVSYIGAYGYTLLFTKTVMITQTHGPAKVVTTAPSALLAYPYDTILMIIVFAIIYVFGLRATYKTEDIEDVIEEQKELEQAQ